MNIEIKDILVAIRTAEMNGQKPKFVIMNEKTFTYLTDRLTEKWGFVKNARGYDTINWLPIAICNFLNDEDFEVR